MLFVSTKAVLVGKSRRTFGVHIPKALIEIDGAQHYTEEGRQKDEFRTEILEGYDLKLIRFTNRQINTNFRGVCEYIDVAVKASLREGGGPRRGSPKRMK